MNCILFRIIIAVHVLFWLYMIFGSFISHWHAHIILFWLVPIVYIWQSMPIHLLVELEKYTSSSKSISELDEKVKINFLPLVPIKNLQMFCEKHCFASPLGPQGLVILSAIISSHYIRC